MKINLFIISFLVLIFASQGYSAHAVVSSFEGFRCIPSMRETRVQVLVQKDEVQLSITNPMGYDFMPQFDGAQSIFNFSFNKMQGEDLKDLGEFFTFSWLKESCKLDSENFTVNCRSQAQADVKGIQSFGLTTTEITEKYDGESYEKRKFRLSLEKGNIYFVSLEFDKKSCEKF